MVMKIDDRKRTQRKNEPQNEQHHLGVPLAEHAAVG
jgi:hypothetical protein